MSNTLIDCNGGESYTDDYIRENFKTLTPERGAALTFVGGSLSVESLSNTYQYC